MCDVCVFIYIYIYTFSINFPLWHSNYNLSSSNLGHLRSDSMWGHRGARSNLERNDVNGRWICQGGFYCTTTWASWGFIHARWLVGISEPSTVWMKLHPRKLTAGHQKIPIVESKFLFQAIISKPSGKNPLWNSHTGFGRVRDFEVTKPSDRIGEYWP